MNCHDFAIHVLAECTSISTHTGETGIFVALPATFVDGEPLPMYVIDRGPKIQITDGGDTLFHLHNIGFRILGDKRRWSSLKEAIEPFGPKMNDSGEIEFWTDPAELHEGVARYTAALLSAANWEIEHFGQPLDGTALIEEAKEYLSVLRPTATIRENIVLVGVSGKSYKFPFSMDGVLLDAMSSSGASSNSMVRRLVDIRAVPSQQATDIEIVVEDRKNTERSEQDIRLIELLAKPLRISKLREAWQNSATVH
jgi:hypothetical protein